MQKGSLGSGLELRDLTPEHMFFWSLG
jgi:hypothetical protein